MQILTAMRQPGGCKLTDEQWAALESTQVVSGVDARSLLLLETEDWFHVAYVWSVVSMAAYVRPRFAAQQAGACLMYVQACDSARNPCTDDLYKEMLQECNVNNTQKIPGISLLYIGMKCRLTCSLHPPFAVQDTSGRIVGVELTLQDALNVRQNRREVKLHDMPHAVYVKLDDCSHAFLPARACEAHAAAGADPENCPHCLDMKGVLAIKPVTREWHFASSRIPGFKTTVQRTGLPLLPALACPLYSMQGTTADPGMLMHWVFPERLSADLKWLIVYVALSRVRKLANLKSIGLSSKIRTIIEAGPPESMLQAFSSIFGDKPAETAQIAAAFRRS